MSITSPYIGQATRSSKLNITTILALLSLCSLVLEPLFRTASAAVFLLTITLITLQAPKSAFRAIAKFWYLLILPLYCILSTVWSQYPDITFRYSLQLAMTLAAAIILSCRVQSRTLLYLLFYSYGAGVVASLLFGHERDDIGAFLGIFGSKNAFSWHMSVFTLLTIAVLIDKKGGLLRRGAAAVGLVVSPILLIHGQSAGSMLSIIPVTTMMFFFIFSQKISKRSTLVLVGIGVFFLLILSLFILVFKNDVFDFILAVTGKDTSLTGRAELWDYAETLISREPFLGLGFRGFWVIGNPGAEYWWAYFGIASKTGFNFHNVYFSTGVDLGIVGIILEVLVVYAAFFKLVSVSISYPTPANIFFCGFMLLIIITTFAEAVVFYEFSVPSLISYIAFVKGVLESRPVKKSTPQIQRGFTKE